MTLQTINYLDQRNRWPKSGRHILAQFDDASVIVYQAYRPDIGQFAARNNFFGGDFSMSRMSWIKPNFLWMMYRSGWGTKHNQEVTLAVRLKRSAFDEILAQAVHSTFAPETYGSRDRWQRAVSRSNVRLQWDPDHGPGGARQARRAIQLGLRKDVLAHYARDWIIDINDVSGFVAQQRTNVHNTSALVTPEEHVYPVSDEKTRQHLGLDAVV